MAPTTRRFGSLLVTVVIVAGCAAQTSSAPVATPTVAKVSQPASPRPVPTAAAASPATLPAALQGTWVGETRTIPGLTPPAVESFMKLDSREMQFEASEDWGSPILTSVASAVGTSGVRLRLETDSVGCKSGTEGTYAFDLSATGKEVLVSVVEDPCAARISALSGPWTRIECPDNHNCLGDLDAGAHLSVIYTPFVRFADWHYDYGRFAFTVPDGWSNPEDNQDGYVLVPQGSPDGAGIYLFSDVLAHAQRRDPATGYCRSAPEPGVGSSAPDLRDWIRSLPGLALAQQGDVSIGGLTGFSMDLSVDPAWKKTCGWPGATAGVPLFVNAQTTADEGFDWGIDAQGRMRLFILRLAHDRNLVIDVEAADERAWNALLPEATQIVGSFAFRH